MKTPAKFHTPSYREVQKYRPMQVKFSQVLPDFRTKGAKKFKATK